MPKARPHPLKHSELLRRLRLFGVIEDKSRGKGSERMLILASGRGATYKGPQIPIKCHGKGTEHSVRVIDAVLRRFDISPVDFWASR